MSRRFLHEGSQRLAQENRQTIEGRQQIRRDFVEYLRQGFPYRLHWRHPLTGQVHEYKTIEKALMRFRSHYPQQYKVLWAIWMSPERWTQVCESFGIPPRRYTKYFHCAVDHIMVSLYCINLTPQELLENESD